MTNFVGELEGLPYDSDSSSFENGDLPLDKSEEAPLLCFAE
jgi:hypothetical protein